MKTKTHTRASKNQGVTRVLLATTCILLIPLIAMQFENGVAWSMFDFTIAGLLLVSTGLAYEFISRKAKNTTQRIMIGMFLVAALLLVWIQLAVGIFES